MSRDFSKVPDIDLNVCGFPCQSLSLSGKRKRIEDERGNMFDYCPELMTTKEPKFFTLENLKGFMNINKGRTLEILSISLLENVGKYSIHSKVSNTKDYGIPQNREIILYWMSS